VFQGLRTVVYRIPPARLKEAAQWYAGLFRKPPYFDEPFYVGFNIEGFELGLDPSEEKISLGDNVQTYWGVQNIQEATAFCVKLGAKIHSEIKDVGGDIKVATIFDPFGNILGLIENPGFKIG
jgi:predicted enzyme related to lactoylglutathione lyase